MPVEYDEILMSGSDEQLDEFAGGEGIIVDHREEDDAIIEYVMERIPKSGLKYRWIGDQTDLAVTYKRHRTALSLTMSPSDRYRVIRGINGILKGDYEMRVFRYSLLSDTHSLYIKPAAWWAEMDARFPARMEAVFSRISDQTDFA